MNKTILLFATTVK